jgi:hypothetical protein
MAEDCLVVKEYVSRFGLHGKHWIQWGGEVREEILEEIASSSKISSPRNDIISMVRYKDEGIECYHLWVFWKESDVPPAMSCEQSIISKERIGP